MINIRHHATDLHLAGALPGAGGGLQGVQEGEDGAGGGS